MHDLKEAYQLFQQLVDNGIPVLICVTTTMNSSIRFRMEVEGWRALEVTQLQQDGFRYAPFVQAVITLQTLIDLCSA